MKNQNYGTVGIPQNNMGVFDSHSEIVIGRSKYLIERHFTGNRDFRQAVFTAVANEAKRDNFARESA